MNAALNKVVCWQFLLLQSLLHQSMKADEDTLDVDRQSALSECPVPHFHFCLKCPAATVAAHKAAADHVKNKAQNAFIAHQFPDNVSAQFASLISIRSQSAQRMIPKGGAGMTPRRRVEWRGVGGACRCCA